jgi:hypothetical protein
MARESEKTLVYAHPERTPISTASGGLPFVSGSRSSVEERRSMSSKRAPNRNELYSVIHSR